MARQFGRILAAIWDDDEFTDLGPEEQRLYMFLLSQRNLNHAGLLPITLKRWAAKAKKLSATQIEEQLAVLDDARFLVVDHDTEEVLVRTLVRNDAVYKQPRVMGAMVADAKEIASPKLRAALLAEIDRLPLDELNDAPGPKSSPSIRAQVLCHIAELRLALAPSPTPPNPPRQPLPEPLREGGPQGLWEPLPEGGAEPPRHSWGETDIRAVVEQETAGEAGYGQPLPEGGSEGGPEGVYARARARLSPSPIPSPLPGPPSPPAGHAFGAAAGGLATVTDLATRRSDPQTTDELIADWIEHVEKRPPGSVIGRVGKHIKQMLEVDHIAPADIRRGVAAWAQRGKDPSVLPSIVNEVMNAAPRPGYVQQSDLGSDAHMERFLARQAARRAAT